MQLRRSVEREGTKRRAQQDYRRKLKGTELEELEESSAKGTQKDHLDNWKDSRNGILEGMKRKSSGAGAWPELLKGLTKES